MYVNLTEAEMDFISTKLGGFHEYKPIAGKFIDAIKPFTEVEEDLIEEARQFTEDFDELSVAYPDGGDFRPIVLIENGTAKVSAWIAVADEDEPDFPRESREWPPAPPSTPRRELSPYEQGEHYFETCCLVTLRSLHAYTLELEPEDRAATRNLVLPAIEEQAGAWRKLDVTTPLKAGELDPDPTSEELLQAANVMDRLDAIVSRKARHIDRDTATRQEAEVLSDLLEDQHLLRKACETVRRHVKEN